MAKLNIRTTECPRNMGSVLRKLIFQGDDNIYDLLERSIKESQRKVLERYDQTARLTKRSTGKLRELLSGPIEIWLSGDRVSAGAIPSGNLPGYFKIQEEGLSPMSWQQPYRIVGIRSSPSKRGDRLILRSVKKSEAEVGFEEYMYQTKILTIYHPGIKARHFVLFGQDYLRMIMGVRFATWFINKIHQLKVESHGK